MFSQFLYKDIGKCNLSGNRFVRDSILTEIVDSLLYEWEESAPPSVAVQQLVSLLSKPIIKVKFYEHLNSI